MASQAAALPSAGVPSTATSHVPAWIPHWLADGWPADYLPPLIALAAFGLSFVMFLSAKRRERFKLGIDLMMKLGERFESAAMQQQRAVAAAALLAKRKGAIPTLESVLDFFEEVAFLLRRKAVDVEAVYEYFSYWIELYARASAGYRSANQRTVHWEGFEVLRRKVAQFEDWKLSRDRWRWRFRTVHAIDWYLWRGRQEWRNWNVPNKATIGDLRLERRVIEAASTESLCGRRRVKVHARRAPVARA